MTLFKLKKSVILSIVLISSIVLSSCMFAPGMDMRRGVAQGDGLNYAKIEGVSTPVPIIDINEDLVESLNPGPNPPSLPNELLSEGTDQSYRIGVNDVLTVIVWGQEELLSSGGGGGQPLVFRHVREDGTFFFPYAGLVFADGLTQEEVRSTVTRKLAKYFNEPQVDVAVQEYNSKRVVLSGQFVSPVTLPITGVPMTLSRAVSIAGGPTNIADLTDMQLNRRGRLYHLDYQALSNLGAIHDIHLIDGDVLHLPVNQSNSAYVVGEVGRPQKLDLWTGRITLTDALASAAGVSNITGSGNEIYVIRGVDTVAGEKAIYRLRGNTPGAYLLASKFNIRPQDVIFVGPSELTKWNRVISQIFPFARLIQTGQDLESN